MAFIITVPNIEHITTRVRTVYDLKLKALKMHFMSTYIGYFINIGPIKINIKVFRLPFVFV